MIKPGIIPIGLTGSLQNPAWSLDGTKLVFTQFHKGYNEGPSDVCVYDFATGDFDVLLADGQANVTAPGNTWGRGDQIIFSSDKSGHDEVWSLDYNTGVATQQTDRGTKMAYEPSWCPAVRSWRFVYETHRVDEEANGVITISDRGAITEADGDCRQPNWSPDGNWIVYQQLKGGQWDLWLYDTKLQRHRNATEHLEGDKTDATFSPCSKFVLYSGEDAALCTLPVKNGAGFVIPQTPGYHGAASWSPDGKWIACEWFHEEDPDGGPGTALVIIEVPPAYKGVKAEQSNDWI